MREIKTKEGVFGKVLTFSSRQSWFIRFIIVCLLESKKLSRGTPALTLIICIREAILGSAVRPGNLL